MSSPNPTHRPPTTSRSRLAPTAARRSWRSGRARSRHGLQGRRGARRARAAGQAGVRHIVLDLRGLTFIDVPALHELHQAERVRAQQPAQPRRGARHRSDPAGPEADGRRGDARARGRPRGPGAAPRSSSRSYAGGVPAETRAGAPLGPGTVRLVIVLGSINAIGPLSIDMYLPAFPEITQALDTARPRSSSTLTACVAGLALGQLVIGPLSDRFGRRVPLIAALVIYSAASLLCAAATSVGVLIALRFVQGLAGRGRDRDRARGRARPALRRGRRAAVLVADAGHRAGADPRPARGRAAARGDVVAGASSSRSRSCPR